MNEHTSNLLTRNRCTTRVVYQVPDSLGRLTRLRCLRLEENPHLRGPIPATLASRSGCAVRADDLVMEDTEATMLGSKLGDWFLMPRKARRVFPTSSMIPVCNVTIWRCAELNRWFFETSIRGGRGIIQAGTGPVRKTSVFSRTTSDLPCSWPSLRVRWFVSFLREKVRCVSPPRSSSLHELCHFSD